MMRVRRAHQQCKDAGCCIRYSVRVTAHKQSCPTTRVSLTPFAAAAAGQRMPAMTGCTVLHARCSAEVHGVVDMRKSTQCQTVWKHVNAVARLQMA